MKIAILEPIGLPLNIIQEKLSGHEIIAIDSRNWSDAKLIDAISDVDIIALTNRPLSAQVINALPKLKFVAVAFSGIDHVDATAIAARKIPIKNAAGYANTAVAELVFGLMIALARKIPENNEKVRQQGLTNTGTELKNKKLGIVGLGAIGQEVARIAAAFKMQVIVYDRKNGITLPELFARADYITLHIPLLLETKQLVNLALLQKMQSTAYLINCARGPIINTADLEIALKEKMLAGAALDVFDMEPPLPSNYSLLNVPNVIATPHIGFNTAEAVVQKGEMAVNNIIHFLAST